jgi:hypothetical protein
MATNFRSLFRHALGALLACLAGLQPLQAQLDPRLQTSKTDFLDLFQQSTSFKVKPELMTIFDYSGSMQALMYHPEFVNTDTQDTQASVNMIFWLTGAVGTRVPHAQLAFGGTVGTLQSTTFVRPDGSTITEALVNT